MKQTLNPIRSAYHGQIVTSVEKAKCPTCGKPPAPELNWLTAEAAVGFDERIGRCENRHDTFVFLVSPARKTGK